MKYMAVLFLLLGPAAWSQTMQVTVKETASHSDKQLAPEVEALYEFLHVQRFTAAFKMPDKNAHDYVLVMRSISRGGTNTTDTLANSLPWHQMVEGGLMWEPSKGASFMAQQVDSTRMEFRFKVGINSGMHTIPLPQPNMGYKLHEGLRSNGEAVPFQMGKPLPIMVLTQPYPDPPPPDKPVLYRYCFGSDVPPDLWPATFGVPHLYLIELTVIP